MSPFNQLQHLVFFEVLAETEENTAAWNNTQAGLIVLRMFDTWWDFGAASLRENARGIRNIRTSVQLLEQQNPSRGILLSLMDSIERARHPDLSNILPLILAYGDSLASDSQWRLAGDVYLTALRYSDSEPLPQPARVQMQLGHCQRMMGDYDEAANSYAEAGQIAAAMGDLEGMLLARIGDAKVAIDRGRLREARALLDDCIAQTEAVDSLISVRSLAIETRAGLADLSG